MPAPPATDHSYYWSGAHDPCSHGLAPFSKSCTGSLAPSALNCGESPVPSANTPVIRHFPRRTAVGRHIPPPFLRFTPAQVFAQRRRQTRLAASRFRRPFFALVLISAKARHAGIYPPVRPLRKRHRRLAPPGALWQFPPHSRRAIFRSAFSCCRSSVVEHPLGKGEVECSIHSGSTIPLSAGFGPA